MVVKVRIPAGAIGNVIVVKDSPLCELRMLARVGHMDMEAILVSPDLDVPLIANWIGQPSEPVRVKIGDEICLIEIGMIKDMVIEP